ncbi:hypothetical protein MUY14_07850 [Amycolatopsis sp. FBCC-B4732]|uniref:hypothetical protein n=1 Tax=Amycolatopsis sp. FBCC-B4732 TaxID=3079339 RepID=UPI001FF1EC1D|nr:hypothetical protein [Amycolatopsis sp. FBCC-B4732]UOX90528.1 hypothetical protein MUY14_07850 [Amycolatopsis sp. FBCC-B4732]
MDSSLSRLGALRMGGGLEWVTAGTTWAIRAVRRRKIRWFTRYSAVETRVAGNKKLGFAPNPVKVVAPKYD